MDIASEGNADVELRRWFPTVGRSKQPEVRLVCLPALAAGVAPFNQWRRLLPSWVDVLPVRLPGVESRVAEEPISDLDQLVHRLDVQLQLLPALPTVLLGHCFGAVLALELACVMAARNHPPALLWVHSQVAPNQLSRPADVEWSDLWARFVAQAEVPPGISDNESMHRMLLPVLTAQFAIIDGYQRSNFAERLGIPLVSSRGSSDPGISDADLAGWAAVTTAAVDTVLIPGGHNLDQEPVDLLAHVVRRLAPLRGARIA